MAGAGLRCQWCGETFKVKGKSRELFTVTSHADHETACVKAPYHLEKPKQSAAWTPIPWSHGDHKAEPAVVPEAVTFQGGPYHGQRRQWTFHLVDGSTIETSPPLIHPGPGMADSAGRQCSRYMGHYRLTIRDDCPLYVWQETITPKKRLGKQKPFIEAWPHLASQLKEQQ